MKTDAPSIRTSTGEPRLTTVHRDWAAETLGIDAGLSDEDMRRQALQRLEQDGFVLWESADLAVRLLAGGPRQQWGSTDREFLRQIEAEALQSGVTDFADRFFLLSPAERAERFRLLADQCAPFPVFRQRLNRLEPGLSVEPDLESESDDQVRRLGEVILAQFTAAPADAAGIRRTFLSTVVREPALWESQSRLLARRHPWTGELGTELLTGIRDLNASSTWAKRRALRTMMSAPQSRSSASAEAGSSEWRLYLVLLTLWIIGCVSALHSPGRSQKSSPTIQFPGTRERLSIDSAARIREIREQLKAARLLQAGGHENPSRTVDANDSDYVLTVDEWGFIHMAPRPAGMPDPEPARPPAVPLPVKLSDLSAEPARDGRPPPEPLLEPR